jgi:hypothetical protein
MIISAWPASRRLSLVAALGDDLYRDGFIRRLLAPVILENREVDAVTLAIALELVGPGPTGWTIFL